MKKGNSPKLPKLIRIGPYDVPLEVTEKDSPNWGEWWGNEYKISIKPTFPSPQKAAEVVIHELLHAAWQVSALPGGTGTEERAVNALAVTMTQILRDNPKLIDWLAATVVKKRVIGGFRPF